jgi:hypothetical protein
VGGDRAHYDGYLGVEDLIEVMLRYNLTLLERCRQEHLECYDLAIAMPKSRRTFFDDEHFTEEGARLVAEFLAKRLGQTIPSGDSAY